MTIRIFLTFDYIIVQKTNRTAELLASLRSDVRYKIMYEDAAGVMLAPQ